MDASRASGSGSGVEVGEGGADHAEEGSHDEGDDVYDEPVKAC